MLNRISLFVRITFHIGMSRKSYGKSSSLTQPAFHVYFPTQFIDNAAADKEPEACSFTGRLCAEERLEDFFQVFSGDTPTGICYMECHLII